MESNAINKEIIIKRIIDKLNSSETCITNISGITTSYLSDALKEKSDEEINDLYSKFKNYSYLYTSILFERLNETYKNTRGSGTNKSNQIYKVFKDTLTNFKKDIKDIKNNQIDFIIKKLNNFPEIKINKYAQNLVKIAKSKMEKKSNEEVSELFVKFEKLKKLSKFYLITPKANIHSSKKEKEEVVDKIFEKLLETKKKVTTNQYFKKVPIVLLKHEDAKYSKDKTSLNDLSKTLNKQNEKYKDL